MHRAVERNLAYEFPAHISVGSNPIEPLSATRSDEELRTDTVQQMELDRALTSIFRGRVVDHGSGSSRAFGCGRLSGCDCAGWVRLFSDRHPTAVEAADWNRPDWPKLWLYNLHYFDDLVAEGAATRGGWHYELIRRWIAENPPGQGNGWEPYPVSLRLVNWVKWALAGNALGAEAVQSLAVQTRWLRRRLEIHLLGNHIWANAKALVFAGAFFQGEAPSVWLAD